MSSVFLDQGIFMTACDQSVGDHNHQQYELYVRLIEEEVEELREANTNNDEVEQLDALLDILVVTVGALHSLGVDAEGAWREVIRSNMSKVDQATGKVLKRDDGKVMKPDTYSPPVLAPFVKTR
jgi:predicted HAD superfamily Cof-like phosphohydrolase